MTSRSGFIERVVRLVLSLGAAGEIATGGAVLFFPSLVGYLLGEPVDATVLFVARVLATALLALGLTWWFARNPPGGVERCATGFLVYNLVVGALFLVRSLAHASPVSWLVAFAHLGLGLGFAVPFLSSRSTLSPAR